MRSNLRRFRNDCTIHMIDDCSPGAKEPGRMSQKQRRVGALPARIGRREMFADVAKAGRAQERIGQRMKDDVGIAVAGEPAAVRDFDAAEHDRAFTGKGMDIKAHAGPGAEAAA